MTNSLDGPRLGRFTQAMLRSELIDNSTKKPTPNPSGYGTCGCRRAEFHHADLERARG